MSKEIYNVTRLRDGANLPLKAEHALNLLRLNATQSKSEFELNEKNYGFDNNEIYKRPNTRKAKDAEVQTGNSES